MNILKKKQKILEILNQLCEHYGEVSGPYWKNYLVTLEKYWKNS